eukprot:TRINITY_DN2909_c0_g1_i1.p1 TRINITY_DN2909_c0_g1~~TRINITY_DN2909_c0_g1_i1.p1  ORF type:complete len:299 (-),score=76.95 TRINITY_DN2909_c0_g1_i1:118-1014(-)
MIPQLGLGTWRSDANQVEHAVKAALELGYRHIDCASVYCNEAEVGRGLAAFLQAHPETPRSEIFITSKLWNTDHHPDHVEAACRLSLQRLGLDYLDLYLVHWPTAFRRNENNDLFPYVDNKVQMEDIPLRDTWAAMEQLVHKGLVRNIGLSNYSIEEMKECLQYATIKPLATQVEIHVYWQQPELTAFCQQHNIQMQAYCPLGMANPAKFASPMQDPLVLELAQHYQRSPAQICLRFLVQCGHIVLPKSVTPSRIQENAAIFDFALSDADMERLRQLGAEKAQRQVNPGWKGPGVSYF